MIYAHCYRSGEIEFSPEEDLPGMICVGWGEEAKLREVVGVCARHAYDGETLLVPGIPEAEDDFSAEAAMQWFLVKVRMRMEKETQQ